MRWPFLALLSPYFSAGLLQVPDVSLLDLVLRINCLPAFLSFHKQLDLRNMLPKLARRNLVSEHLVYLGRSSTGDFWQYKVTDNARDGARSSEAVLRLLETELWNRERNSAGLLTSILF
jgi:hypothetical protein